MKRLFLIPFFAALVVVSCAPKKTKNSTESQILSRGIAFCESVLPYADELLVANFGTSECNPLNTEGRGYILAFRDTVSRVLIPADGRLSAPKGMLIKDDHLFICDVNRLLVYNLRDTAAAPQVITFPQEELFVNDLALSGNTLYISVTNTGNIYSLAVDSVSAIDSCSLKCYANVVGANGLLIRDSTMYIASYPADGVTSEENLIYRISNLSAPTALPLINRTGQYDGLAMNAAGDKLYFSGWVNGELGVVDLPSGVVSLLTPGIEMVGPARMVLQDGKLYIPDLPNSRVVIHTL